MYITGRVKNVQLAYLVILIPDKINTCAQRTFSGIISDGHTKNRKGDTA